jgi:hypothetical protein
MTGPRAPGRRCVGLDDWHRLTLEGRRDIIRVVVERIVVAPVNGAGLSGSKWDESRVDVQLFGEG